MKTNLILFIIGSGMIVLMILILKQQITLSKLFAFNQVNTHQRHFISLILQDEDLMISFYGGSNPDIKETIINTMIINNFYMVYISLKSGVMDKSEKEAFYREIKTTFTPQSKLLQRLRKIKNSYDEGFANTILWAIGESH